MENTTIKTLDKRTEEAFGKKVYLIGMNMDGDYIWLEEPKWDCGWYWGFGYIETYTNNKHPEKSKDIDSHSHFNSCIAGYKHKDGEYIHHPHANPDLAITTLTPRESWLLAEYMKTYYTLKESAGVFNRGGSHLTSCDDQRDLIQDKGIEDKINTHSLPELFKLIDRLLSPAQA